MIEKPAFTQNILLTIVLGFGIILSSCYAASAQLENSIPIPSRATPTRTITPAPTSTETESSEDEDETEPPLQISMTLFRDEGSITLYVPRSDKPVSLAGFYFRIGTPRGIRTYYLEQVFGLGSLINNIPTPACFQLRRYGYGGPLPRDCQQTGLFLLVQELTEADAFWYDSSIRQHRILIVPGGIQAGRDTYCSGSQPACEILFSYELTQCYIEVLEGMQNIRSGPGVDYEIIGKAPHGTVFESLGRYPPTGWYAVEYENQIGWMAGHIMRITGKCGILLAWDEVSIVGVAPPEPSPEPPPPEVVSEIFTYTAYQRYEKGFMLWRQDDQSVLVFVGENEGRTFTVLFDTYGGLSENPIPDIPEGCIRSINDFGRVWGHNLSGAQDALGCAKSGEQGFDMLITRYSDGSVGFTLPDGREAISEGGRWRF